jgi:hypothetical protein
MLPICGVIGVPQPTLYWQDIGKRLPRSRPSRRDAAWYRCYFAFRFSVVALSLDADQQVLVEDAKDPLKHGTRANAVARFGMNKCAVPARSATPAG